MIDSLTIRLGSDEDRPRRYAQVVKVRHAHEARFYVGVTIAGQCIKFHETDIIVGKRIVPEVKPCKP